MTQYNVQGLLKGTAYIINHRRAKHSRSRADELQTINCINIRELARSD